MPDITTLLDALGLILLAVGLGFAAAVWIGPAGIGVTGLAILAGSQLSVWLEKRR